MSITFWIPDAPLVDVTHSCEVCEGSGASDYDDDGVCPYCHGVGQEIRKESSLPSLNLSNSNAHAFLRFLFPGIASDDCGRIAVVALPALRTRLWLATQGAAASLVSAPVQEGIVWQGGRSEEYVTRRAGDLLVVFDAAIKAQMPITWG